MDGGKKEGARTYPCSFPGAFQCPFLQSEPSFITLILFCRMTNIRVPAQHHFIPSTDNTLLSPFGFNILVLTIQISLVGNDFISPTLSVSVLFGIFTYFPEIHMSDLQLDL